MTLNELLEELHALPQSSRTAVALVCQNSFDDYGILNVRYEDGEVFIDIEDDDQEEGFDDDE